MILKSLGWPKGLEVGRLRYRMIIIIKKICVRDLGDGLVSKVLVV